MFESCVVLDGDKTDQMTLMSQQLFESCVVLDGDKTRLQARYTRRMFESCVVLDGDKTLEGCSQGHDCLRVVLF